VAYTKSDKGKLLLLFFILLGVVLGSLIGDITSDSSFFRWMNIGHTFGLLEPFKLDLKVIYLELQLLVRLNIASVIGIILGVFVYRRI
jgi:hypothetical protein